MKTYKSEQKTNVLLLSVGTRNKIVRYFKEEFKSVGKVIATDMSELAPAIYEADKYYLVPPISAENYLDVIYDICEKESIGAVLSLIDPELSLLAKNEKRFKDLGVTIIGSSYEMCEMSLDKMKMYRWLETNGFNCAKSYDDKNLFYDDLKKGKINFPVFVKPIKGSASVAISKVHQSETIEILFENSSDLMIQEFLNGQEIGADVYIDLISKEVVSIFTKKKIAMRAGETDKAVSFKDDKLFSVIERFVKKAGFCGQIDIDIFEIDGRYYISEVNPRFGGGYPHAYECGCNHIKLIKNNLEGRANKARIGLYESGVYMMKYNDLLIKRS
ncbi:MAG: ATP-grasp domain-containing protein [Clostridia bacterium]|nr:ATP-grasp domain-containing protein [Clostridia bacterium]